MVLFDLIWFNGLREMSANQNRLLEALFRALVPLARSLLRVGIGYREFAEVSKMAFTHVASVDYGLRGRPTNSSRIAVITGLSRKEVGRVRSLTPHAIFSNLPVTPAAEVLHLWNTDPRYLDSSGKPMVLDIKGCEPSFAELVSNAVGDIPPGAMRTELMRVGAIREAGDGKLAIEKRYFVPDRVDEKLQHGFDVAFRYLGETLAFNSDPQRKGRPRFERVVSSTAVSTDRFKEIERKSRDMLKKFTEDYDDMLSQNERVGRIPEEESEIGVGLYFFRSDNGDEAD